MRHIADSDVLSQVVYGVEGFVGLQAERRDGEEDEEEGTKCHILQRGGGEEGRGGLICFQFQTVFVLTILQQTTTATFHICERSFLWLIPT